MTGSRDVRFGPRSASVRHCDAGKAEISRFCSSHSWTSVPKYRIYRPDVDRARSFASQTPVVQRPDRHVEVLRELFDGHQRLQAAQGGCCVSMSGRCATQTARLRTGRGDSAPEALHRPEDGSPDPSFWTLSGHSIEFSMLSGSESLDSEPEIRSGGRI